MAHSNASTQAAELITPPESLLSKNPLRWLKFFGPGAIIASCTIGSGEVLFSSRGGAVFGYNILWVFILASFLKWVLCYCSMRHMILSGAHPSVPKYPNIFAGLTFVGFGIMALWDDWKWTDQKWMAYVILAGMVGVGMLLAVTLRKYLYQAPASSSAVGKD